MRLSFAGVVVYRAPQGRLEFEPPGAIYTWNDYLRP